MEPRIQIASDFPLKNIRDFHLIGAQSNKLEIGPGIAAWWVFSSFHLAGAFFINYDQKPCDFNEAYKI